MATVRFFVSQNITPAPVIMSRIRGAVHEESELLARRVANEHEHRVSSWNDPPHFTHESDGNLNPGEPNFIVFVVGNEIQVKKWFWVDKGTAVRYAQVSPDWQSKTQPGQRTPGAGQGRVLYIDRNRPRPGIKPRDFSKTIKNDLNPEVVAGFRRGVLRGLNGNPLSLEALT